MIKYIKYCILVAFTALALILTFSFGARNRDSKASNNYSDQSQVNNIEIKSEKYVFPEEIDIKIDVYDISKIRVTLGSTTYNGLDFYMGIDNNNNLQIYYKNGEENYTLANVNLFSDDESIDLIISMNKNMNYFSEYNNVLSHNGIVFSFLYGSHSVYTIYVAIGLDDQPYTLLYDIASGSLIENDINDDGVNELLATFDGRFYYIKDNVIYKGTYVLGNGIMHSYFDENSKHFVIYFSDRTSVQYSFNNDLSFLIPEQ